MKSISDFTEGPILAPLLKFAFPILFAMLLQTMYGAVDLIIIGQFCDAAAVSAVSNGSHIMMTISNVITGISLGMTILLGQKIGEKKLEEAGQIIGSGIVLFFILAVITSVLMIFSTPAWIKVLRVPTEAISSCKRYMIICSAGILFIVAYNLLGAIFRGLGNSKLPLIIVAIASVFNVFGDLFFVAVFISYFGFFHGDLLCSLFSKDNDVTFAGWQYLKGYSIDVLFTSFLFCFIGFYNGAGRTKFVMLQGIFGAFCIRVPVSFIIHHFFSDSIFYLSLATPCSTFTQIIICFIYAKIFWKSINNAKNC